ncbi:unnamed protein product [Ceratitis capitata]|uniref:(Mediterranean fruit fly) hypothetical protein n=1 Tax=Ceratitis capitata TaxID=7213 RepID=A0A811UNY7_CERCA|nr:unnamed protein product [Ceratitis capitata]
MIKTQKQRKSIQNIEAYPVTVLWQVLIFQWTPVCTYVYTCTYCKNAKHVDKSETERGKDYGICKTTETGAYEFSMWQRKFQEKVHLIRWNFRHKFQISVTLSAK